MGSDGHVIREVGYDYGVVERWAGALSFISCEFLSLFMGNAITVLSSAQIRIFTFKHPTIEKASAECA